jgi:hypothetical protein
MREQSDHLGLAPERPASHPTLNAQSRHLKADAVALRHRCEMHPAVEPHAEHRNTTLAWRAAGGHRCWRTAIRLRGVNLADSCPHFCSHGFLRETTADRRTTIEIASAVKKGSKQGSKGMMTLVDVKTNDYGGSGWIISGRLAIGINQIGAVPVGALGSGPPRAVFLA